VAHATGLRERETFGERVEAAAQLHPAQQSLELWSDGERAHRLPRTVLDGEVLGVAGEPPGDHRAGQRWLERGVFGAAFEHAADQPDVDDLVVERAGARRVNARAAPHFFTRPNSA
jgi:hypothetical protein